MRRTKRSELTPAPHTRPLAMDRSVCYARRFRFAQVQKGPVVASSIVLNVDVRTANGSGAARELRRAEKVPGVLYGGPRGPVAIEIEKKLLVKALRSGKFISHMVTLEHKGERQPVIPKAIQYHPVTEEPLHFDLYRVEETSIIDVEVPVRFINQELSPGLKAGATLNVVRHMVELHVPAGNIPEEIVIDLTGTKVGDVIHISAVTLPAGATPTIKDRDFTIATIAGRGGPAAEEAA